MATWPTLYVSEANKSDCGIVAVAAIAEAFGKRVTAEACLRQAIVPMQASGKLATGMQEPAFVFAPHVLARDNRHNGKTPVKATLAEAWRQAGFKAAGFANDSDIEASAGVRLAKLADNPKLLAKAPAALLAALKAPVAPATSGKASGKGRVRGKAQAPATPTVAPATPTVAPAATPATPATPTS